MAQYTLQNRAVHSAIQQALAANAVVEYDPHEGLFRLAGTVHSSLGKCVWGGLAVSAGVNAPPLDRSRAFGGVVGERLHFHCVRHSPGNAVPLTARPHPWIHI